MTTPSLYNPREATQIHLEIVDLVIDMIQDTFPAAATLDCHQQMRDILTRIKNTLDHPILFAAHIIVYLVKAVRYSRRWATLVKNIAALDPSLFKTRFSASSIKSQASTLTPSPPSSLHTQDSRLQTQDSLLSVPVRVRPCPSQPLPPSISSIPSISSDPSHPSYSSSSPSVLSTQHSALSFRHSLEARLRIRAFAQALQHERHLAEKLPPSVPKPDLTPILPVHRHPSVLSTQHSALFSNPSALSTQHSALSSQPPLFPSEAFWESKVRSLQLKILGNITRIFPALGRAYLKHYNASISSTPSTPSATSTPSFRSHSPHSSHSSYPSHSSPLPPPHSLLSPQRSALSSHPPPQHP